MMKMMMTTTCRASSRLVFLLAMVALACTTCASFTATSKMTFQSARAVPGAMAQFKRTAGVLRQSDEGSEPENKNKPMPTSGTYYDDEVNPIPVTKVGISESMKERLTREAATGLDSDQKQTNTILYIMAAVAVLVVLGGKDILF